MAARKTPVMQQHADAKAAYPDAVIFFRMGDFYEMFGEDAVLAARELELTLTSRNKGKPDEIPMAGVPHHAAHGYLSRLIERGYKVAICEQMADPSTVRGIVPRAVVRVVTPGLTTHAEQLTAGANNWLAALQLEETGIGVALLDLSTGELRGTELLDRVALYAELCRAAPREVLVGTVADVGSEAIEEDLAAIQRLLPRAAVRPEALLEDDETQAALGELLEETAALGQPAQRAVARALRFVRRCNPGKTPPIVAVGRWEPAEHLLLDPVAQAHLELVDSAAGGREATLLNVIDATRTPMGARLLRRRLLAPLKDVETIRRRLDLVESFVVHQRMRVELRTELAAVGDIERLAMRAALHEANPRDLGATRDGLLAAARAAAVLTTVADDSLLEALGLDTDLDLVTELQVELGRALIERPPAQPKDGSVFRAGFDAELEELDALRRSGAERMVELESTLRERTGIANLKVRFTRVFGWYIEVSRAQVDKAPVEWRRKQTVASGERYTTPELDDLADRITHAEERHRERELELLGLLGELAARHAERVRRLAGRLARWDVAAGLADVAHRNDYCRPHVEASRALEIDEGRHPVVERLAAAGRFVPNDVRLDVEQERLWLVTGPNMAGKSTLLRQTALIVILAQMGAYVPARRARVGLVDRVLSRVGANDNLARGESTFMVEMRETSEILRSATRDSLVILDEIGRGTSTYDGLAIAWAVAEHLDQAIGCRALFATHYHELTQLTERSAHVANYSVSAQEHNGDIVFLHRLVPGAASRSYGVAVAKLAGLPRVVLERSQTLLEQLEAQRGGAPRGDVAAAACVGPPHPQLSLFSESEAATKAERGVLDSLSHVDPDTMTPLEALSFLSRTKARLGRKP